MSSAMSHKPDPQPSQPPAVRAEVARMQAGAAPRPPSLAPSATSADVLSPSSPESPETIRREGPGSTGRQRGEGAVVGKGEGGDKGGQAEAGRGGAEGVAAGAEGQGEGQGQRAAKGPRADPFNVVDVRAGMDMRRREWRSQRELVVADILEVSEDEVLVLVLVHRGRSLIRQCRARRPCASPKPLTISRTRARRSVPPSRRGWCVVLPLLVWRVADRSCRSPWAVGGVLLGSC